MDRLYQPFFLKSLSATAIIVLIYLPLLGQDVLEGVVRVKVNEALAATLEAQNISTNFAGDVVTGVSSLDQLNKQFSVRRFTRVFPHAGKNEARHRKHGLHLWYEIRTDKNIPISSILQSYQSEKQILRAEPVYKKAIIGSQQNHFGPRKVPHNENADHAILSGSPNDPLLKNQWHYNNTGQTGGKPGADISLFDAWKIETGNRNVIIAVTDGGVDFRHPDLADNMWVNADEVAGNNVDDDNNGYVDDIHGYGFVNRSGKIAPDSHGTHVAGTIAAVSNNGKGVAGVAGGSGKKDGVRIMSCAVFHPDSASDGFAEAYVYSADNGAVISQNSWGYTAPDVFEQVVLDAIDYFIAEAGKNVTGQQTGPMNGGLAIFSAGNFNSDENYYPAYYEPVLAVASTTHKDIKAQYSNYGSWVDITAPGGETFEKEEEGVLSTLPGNQYGSFMGTSMACPHVSGVAGLILSKFGKPGLRPEVVRERIRQSVDDIDAANNGYVGLLGKGRLNAVLALTEGDSIPPAAVNDLRVTDNEIGKITLSWTSPKDDNGVVAEYDLRYATSSITNTTFADATSAGTLPAPNPAGTTDTFTVSGLPGGVLFYFAIRSKDFEGNTSALSNVVSKTSALAPVLTVTPKSLTENLRTAERSSRILTIRNDGAGPLEFSIPESPEAFATATPAEGTVMAGNSSNITVAFDASGMFTGTYKQDLMLQTNDPAQEEVAIPLTLQVTNNGAPIASIKEDTLDFKSVQAGRSRVRVVTISNAGSEPLVINEVTCDVPAFAPDSLSARSIDPFESADVRITFSPASAGVFSGTVFILTNDPQRAALSVSVRGEGLQEAPILASPNSFNESLERGTKTTGTLVLHNNGSQDRSFRIDVRNNGVASVKGSKNGRAIATQERTDSDSTLARQRKILQQHQSKLATRPPNEIAVLKTFGTPARSKIGDSQARKTQNDEAGVRQYMTGFEEFNEGPVGSQEDWFTTSGWTIESENPARGVKHLRGKTERSGTGEEYAVSPYLFEAEEYYYPQYTSASMRINADKAKGTTWEMVPQDPWSYIATRIRFNADGSVEAMVIDNDYMTHFKKVPVTLPSGYFDLAIEYNNWGSDTSGFPTYLLFINNQHVFSGTGLASGIGQVAFVSSMQAAGSIFDIDEFKLAGDEYLPIYIRSNPEKGVIPAGKAAEVALEFDASVMKFGSYKSDLIVRLDDDTDSLVIPTQLHVTGEASMTRDVYAIYGEMNKGEEGIHYITLTNTGGQPIAFNFQTDLEGLNVNPASGTLKIRENKTIVVSFKNTPGIYNDEIVLTTDTGKDPEQIPVNMTVFDSGSIFYSPPHVQFDINAGEITTKHIQLRNDGENTVSFMTELSPFAQPFLEVVPASATIIDDPLDFSMTFDARNLGTGKHEWWIRFVTNDADRRTIDMPLIVNVLPDIRGAGKIAHEVWTGLPGIECTAIPVNTPPFSASMISSFQIPSNTGDNYGSRIRGYVRAPQTGYYTFWIASNDNSELWLSEDESALNKRKIASVNGYTNPAQWNKYPTQMSSGIFLEANKRYYIEALHKEGVGTDHLAVGWQLPDEAMERPIPGLRLIPYGTEFSNTSPRIIFTTPRGEEIFTAPATIDLQADASDEDGNIVKVEFYNGTEKLGADVSAPYSIRWTNVSSGIHSVHVLATDNSGAIDSASLTVVVTEGQSCTEAGQISREQWNNIPGTLISSIPVNEKSSLTENLTQFESPSNTGDNYGARVRGLLCVPTSGEYTFWIASNDKSELWLSTDHNIANKKRIAFTSAATNERQWDKFTSQKSSRIYLESGKQYYIEALHKEGIGTDHLSVGWQLPDGTLERPIPGIRLLPYKTSGNEYPLVTITQPAQDSTFISPATVELSADASDPDGSIVKVEFYNGSVKLGEDTTAPYNFSWKNILEGTYTITAVARDNKHALVTSAPVEVSVVSFCAASGNITREYWTQVPGNHVSAIPVNTFPHGTEELTLFEGPLNYGTNYGARIRGYICPPVTGEYFFWIASNDHSELWLSHDEDAGNKRKIAYVTGATGVREWRKFASQTSAPVLLTQGKKYYIEVLHKQGAGTDHVAVGWQLPDGTLERPIPGSRLSPFHSHDDGVARTSPAGEIIAHDLQVYPNPVTSEKLTIIINNFSQTQGTTREITIRQLTGLEVYSEKSTCQEDCSTEIEVNSNFTPGVYILQVKLGAMLFTEKLIVP